MAKIGSSGKPPINPGQSGPSSGVQSPSTSPQISPDISKQKTAEEEPKPKSKLKTVRTAASEAHAKGIKEEKDKGQAAKQQSLLESVRKDVGRELGNIGIIGKSAAEKITDQASTFGKGLFDKLLGKNPAMSDIKKTFGKEVSDDFKTAQKSAQGELSELLKKQEAANGYLPDADDREKLKRLVHLNKSFHDEPVVLAKYIKENRDDPTYKFMGPAQFASLEVASRDLVDKNEASRGKSYGLTAMERVGIYGYTTKDFTKINPALRASNGGPVSDPQLQSYLTHVRNGLSKLDDFVPSHGQRLYRGITSADLPPSVKANYKVDGKLQDFAFCSTSTKDAVPGDLKMLIFNTAGKGGKLLPFSAHAGEGEVLFPPGTSFDVIGKTPMDARSIPKGWTVDRIADHEAKQNTWTVRIS